MSRISQKAKVENYLRKHGDATLARVAHETRLTRQAVSKRVHDLRNEGKDIDSVVYRRSGRSQVRYIAYL